MRRSGWMVFGTVCAAVLIVALLAVVGNLRHEKISQRQPLTIQDLDRLAGSLNVSTPKASRPTANNAQPPLSEKGYVELPQNRVAQSPELEHPAVAPLGRLERPATSEERAKRWGQTNETGRLVASFASGALMSVINAALYAAGRSEGAAWERAQAMLVRGDWSAARSYFAEFLETSSIREARRDACAYLAWLEDDPEVATLYMELACSDENDLRGGCLAMCEELARLTGNEPLADQYLARLRDVHQRRENNRLQQPSIPSIQN